MVLGARLLDAGQGRLDPLVHGEHADLAALVDGQVLHRQPTEDVVDEARGEPELAVVGHPGGLEAHVRELLDERPQRHAELQAERHRDREAVHDPGQGRALLGDLEEELARPPVLELADRHVPVAVGDPERERLRVALLRQLLPDRLLRP